MYAPPRVDGLTTISTIHALDVSGEVFQYTATPGSNAYPLANLALYIPFSVSEAVTAFEGWVVTGTVAGGNFDIGVYSAAGSRLTSSGSTARTASAVNNTTAMTNLVLQPGTRYYMAFSADATSNYFAATEAAGLRECQGVLESTTSFVLPSSPTLSRTTRAYIPLFGLNLYSVAL
jgi:hypothetical protein